MISLTVLDFGYRDCAQLTALAREWFGSPGRERMMAVWSHMDTCDICQVNHQAIADYEEWLAHPELFVVEMEVLNDPIPV